MHIPQCVATDSLLHSILSTDDWLEGLQHTAQKVLNSHRLLASNSNYPGNLHMM